MPFDLATTLQQMPLYLLQAHGPEAAESMDLWQHIVQSNVINVLLVLGFITWIIKQKNLLSGIDTHRSRIASEIETVEGQKQEALRQLEDAKRRTANLSAEVEEILRNARESAESLSAQIVADARAESTKIVDNAKKRVELEQRSAIKELEARLLNEALADARADMARSLTAADQKRSVEAFLDELSHVKGGR